MPTPVASSEPDACEIDFLDVRGSERCPKVTRLAHATARLDGRVLPPDCLGSVGAPTEPNFSGQERRSGGCNNVSAPSPDGRSFTAPALGPGPQQQTVRPGWIAAIVSISAFN